MFWFWKDEKFFSARFDTLNTKKNWQNFFFLRPPVGQKATGSLQKQVKSIVGRFYSFSGSYFLLKKSKRSNFFNPFFRWNSQQFAAKKIFSRWFIFPKKKWNFSSIPIDDTVDPGQIQPLEVQPASLGILVVEFRMWSNFMNFLSIFISWISKRLREDFRESGWSSNL